MHFQKSLWLEAAGQKGEGSPRDSGHGVEFDCRTGLAQPAGRLSNRPYPMPSLPDLSSNEFAMLHDDGGKPMLVFMQTSQDSDRAAALVAGAMVETLLEQAVRACLRGSRAADIQTKALKEALERTFNIEGALGTFGRKINFAFLNGIYGETALKELMIIKDIRNKFAHDILINSFEAAWVRNKCYHLKQVESFVVDATNPPDIRKSTGFGSCQQFYKPEDFLRFMSSPRERYVKSCEMMCHFLRNFTLNTKLERTDWF